MTPRTEYLEALAAFGTPRFAFVSFGLCFAVFGVSLAVMFLRSSATLDRQARLPLDPSGTEHVND